jgi:hypothetical protein
VILAVEVCRRVGAKTKKLSKREGVQRQRIFPPLLDHASQRHAPVDVPTVETQRNFSMQLLAAV